MPIPSCDIDNNSYTITLTGKQIRVIAEALDFWYRIQMGQFKVILELFCAKNHDRYQNWDVTRLLTYTHLYNAKKELFPDISTETYLGIFSHEIHEDSKIAADIYDDINIKFKKDSNYKAMIDTLGRFFPSQPRLNITENVKGGHQE